MKNLECLGVEVVWYRLDKDEMTDIDILQVFSSEPCLLPIIMKAKRRGIPVIITPMIGSRATSNLALRCAIKFSLIPGMFSPHKERFRLIKQADHLLALSRFEKNRLQTVYKINDKDITIAENGLDARYIVTEDMPENGKNERDYVLTVGRIEPNKNQYNLIKAVKQLGIKLYIVGEPGIRSNDYYEKCKLISDESIEYKGPIKDVEDLKRMYLHAKVTVIPSYSEMVPLTVFESLSVKTPVVVTKFSSLKGTKLNGLFFTGTSHSSIKRAIKKALSYDNTIITKEGIYDWRQIAEKYLSVYQKFDNK